MSNPPFPGDEPLSDPASPPRSDAPESGRGAGPVWPRQVPPPLPPVVEASDDLFSSTTPPTPAAMKLPVPGSTTTTFTTGGPLPPAAVAEFPAPRAPLRTPTLRMRTPARQAAVPTTFGVRLFATLALGAATTTYVAVEVDLVRRHFPGIDPIKYWLPQLRQITLPGLGAALLCAVLAFGFHKFKRRA